MTLELISLIPLVGSLEENPLSVKLLDNRLYMILKLIDYLVIGIAARLVAGASSAMAATVDIATT